MPSSIEPPAAEGALRRRHASGSQASPTPTCPTTPPRSPGGCRSFHPTVSSCSPRSSCAILTSRFRCVRRHPREGVALLRVRVPRRRTSVTYARPITPPPPFHGVPASCP